MKRSANASIRMRIWIVAVTVGMLLGVISARAVHVQVFCGPALAARAADQYETSIRTSPRRGTILDSDGRPLAVSIEVTSVAARPRILEDPQRTARRLAAALELDAADLLRRLRSERPFVWVKRQVGPDQARTVADLDIKGVSFHREYRRYYPNTTLAGQVLGFCDIDGKGLEGIELRYEDQLNAAAASRRARRDALGRRFDPETAARQPAGSDLVLTLDAKIQHIAETALGRAVSDYEARAGMAVAIDPATGAVLAMAHQPQFNANAFTRYPAERRRNRIVTDRFEPGSTMKIFMAAAALESGVYTPDSIFFCENGAYRVGNHTVHDTRPHGWLSLAHIVKFSSNIGAVKIGEGIGHAALHDTLDHFGFGRRTGIDLPGESTGYLPPQERWTQVDAGTIAFGQGISVTALQLAAATAAVANDGLMMRPYLVQELRDARGRVTRRVEPRPVGRVVSVRTARRVKQILGSVLAADGTGRRAALNGYSAGGKTGTAQKVAPTGGYAKDRFVSSFVGFAPLNRPRIAVLVVLDEPRRNHYGGVVAAPVFRQIAYQSLDYLHVAPTRRPDRLILAHQNEVNG